MLHSALITLTHFCKVENKPLPCVRYRTKVKLHGNNTAIQVNSDGLVFQSRTGLLTAKSDLHGFAKWASANEQHFKNLPAGIVIFGEWAGPGIEKGMAISQIASKIFAIFAVQVGRAEDAYIVYDPGQISELLGPALSCPDLHVLPFEETEELNLDWSKKEQMESMLNLFNNLVDRVEKEDPWVKRTFGISGLGEGLVFYPEPNGDKLAPAKLAMLMFKAKGLKHRTAATKEAVQVDATVVENAAGFVDLMLTNARLEQGVSAACSGTYDIRDTGKFLAWVLADVQKESVAELQAAALDWKQVMGPVQTRAREWYKERCLANKAN